MRKTIIAVTFLLLSGVLASAQESKAEVFGGYSYLHFNAPDSGNFSNQHSNTNGWEAALTGNVNRWFGITADFDGHYGNLLLGSGNVHNALFGPKLTIGGARNSSFFVHGLGGVSHFSALGNSQTAGAWALGGGMDLRSSKRIGFRLGQIDYQGSHFSGGNQNNFRFSTGLLLNLGK
jgi:hypothetical protein